ncbi:MAG: 4-demethylwyosine synthase TYW1 [Candidatus Nanoarchaeia archaeon]
MEEGTKKLLEKQGYRIVGNNSACKICEWTKKSILDKDVCYKQQFYGIKSHECCQMTPNMTCINRCVFCWRDTAAFTNTKAKFDEPEEIIKGCIEAQRKLLVGFFGNEKANKKKLIEAKNPKYFAISLTGEPTIYPKLSELIEGIHKIKACTFLVSNGLFPKNIEKLNTLPRQLYISVDAPNKKLYKEIVRPVMKNSWENFNKTLELLPSLNTRTVLRLTMIRNKNMREEKGYTEIIKKSKPRFIEVKSYMWLGHSKQNLEKSNMPTHTEIKQFSKKIAEQTGYKIIDEKENSRVVLLAEEDSKTRFL